MDQHTLKRLGHHIVSRRVALGYRNRTDLADNLQLTVRTLADIEHGVRKASPGTYAMLENKLGWSPGTIENILAGKDTPSTPAGAGALYYSPVHALNNATTDDLLRELRRRINGPRLDRGGEAHAI